MKKSFHSEVSFDIDPKGFHSEQVVESDPLRFQVANLDTENFYQITIKIEKLEDPERLEKRKLCKCLPSNGIHHADCQYLNWIIGEINQMFRKG